MHLGPEGRNRLDKMKRPWRRACHWLGCCRRRPRWARRRRGAGGASRESPPSPCHPYKHGVVSGIPNMGPEPARINACRHGMESTMIPVRRSRNLRCQIVAMEADEVNLRSCGAERNIE